MARFTCNTQTKDPAIFGVPARRAKAVHGESTSVSFIAGVSGVAVNPGGVGPGVLGQSKGSGPGVVGLSDKDAGVIGFHGYSKLNETTVASDGGNAGVFGASENGAGVLGYARDPGEPAVFAFGGLKAIALGKPFAGDFIGDVRVDGDILLVGADCAEQFDVVDEGFIEPGEVVVIDQEGALRQSRDAYDTRVAGVVSGAGTYRRAIILDKQAQSENRLSISLVGKVFCKVDGRDSPIAVGDLLTTSPTPGHAMKATDSRRAFSAALSAKRCGRGAREAG